MARVNLAQAKARLSELVDAALGGEEVVLARRNVPVAKIVPLKPKKNAPEFGMFRGRIEMSPDFDEPLAAFAEFAGRAGQRRPRRKR